MPFFTLSSYKFYCQDEVKRFCSGEKMNTSYDVAVSLENENNWLRRAIYYVRMCFVPIIVAGTVTNILCFVVLSKKEMRRLSTSVYLLALACADLGVMYFELFRVWFEWLDIIDPEIYFTTFYCKVANFTNGIVRDFSNWLIACLTLERVIMVASPYKAKNFCTVKNARTVTITLFLIICLPHTHCIAFSKPTKLVWWVCWEDEQKAAASIIAALVEFVVGYVVVVVVFVLNIILVILLYKSNFSSVLTTRTTEGRLAQGRRLTRTLLFVAVVFLVCETPRMIVSFMCRFLERTNQRRIILNVSYVISGINHASNFFIYTLSSPRFRLLFYETIKFKNDSSTRSCCKRLNKDSIVVDVIAFSND